MFFILPAKITFAFKGNHLRGDDLSFRIQFIRIPFNRIVGDVNRYAIQCTFATDDAIMKTGLPTERRIHLTTFISNPTFIPSNDVG